MNNKDKPSGGKKLPLALLLLLSTALSVALYFGAITFSENNGIYIPVIEIYTVLLLCLFFAAVTVNCGFSKGSPTADMLPDKWSDEKKSKFVASFPKRKKAVRVLSFLIIILAVPVCADVLIMALEEIY